MLINFSRKSHSEWSNKQLDAANKKYEKIIDIEAPILDSNLSDIEIRNYALTLVEELIPYYNNADLNNASMFECDPFLAYCLVKELIARGYECITPIFDPQKDFLYFREFF